MITNGRISRLEVRFDFLTIVSPSAAHGNGEDKVADDGRDETKRKMPFVHTADVLIEQSLLEWMNLQESQKIPI